jgi:hypothetical protein
MRQLIIDALQNAGLNTPDVESAVARGLKETVRDWIVVSYVAKIARQLRSRRHKANPRQGWLALPEYQHVPVECADDSLEELRGRIARLKKRIRGYGYVRRELNNLKADKLELRDLEKLEKAVTPYFVGTPGMTVTRAVLLHEEYLKTPATEQRRMAIKNATKARTGRNEESTTSR